MDALSNHSLRLDDETIYTRTGRGQREVVFGMSTLGPDERQVLLMVNGYTRLRSLVDLCPDVRDMIATIRHLVMSGLIAAVRVEGPDPNR